MDFFNESYEFRRNWISIAVDCFFDEAAIIKGLEGEKAKQLYNEKIVNYKLKKILSIPKLYKYYSFESPYSLQNLVDGLIYFQNASKFNDPFDCNLGINQEFFDLNFPKEQVSENKMVELRNIINERQDSFKVFCLSQEYDNILMWSHYGDKHKGFCVEYDFKDIFNDVNISMLTDGLYPVLYSDTRPEFPKAFFDLNNLNEILASNTDFRKNGMKEFYKSLLYKSQVWNYEKEWRIILTQSKESTIKFKIIKNIYLGCNCTYNNELNLRESLKKAGINIEPVKMRMSELHYKFI